MTVLYHHLLLVVRVQALQHLLLALRLVVVLAVGLVDHYLLFPRCVLRTRVVLLNAWLEALHSFESV